MKPAIFHLLVVSLGVVACYVPKVRLPLPATFPAIGGATPVPGNNASISVELADGLRGPELGRGEVRGGGIAFGVDDRLSVGYLLQWTSDTDSGVTQHVDVHNGRLKVRIGQLFGARSQVAVHAAVSSSERQFEGLQDDQLSIWEVAVPAEFLLSQPRAGGRASVFVGPRIVFEHYEDHVRPAETFSLRLPGLVSGFHLSVGHLELFLEGTVVHVPQHSYLGVPSGGRVMFMPALSATVRFGPAFRWPAEP
jgi:hypothetical protein